MEKEQEERLKGKVDFFYREKCRVHVSRFDKSFWRGYITERKNDDVYVFLDDKLGSCLLFISDIHKIDIFREVKE